MRVVLIHDARLPVQAYGGTERVVWWLGKALSELGVEVTLACAPQSECRWAAIVNPDFTKPLEEQLPGFDLYHYFNTPSLNPEKPHVVTIGGNGKPSETFLRNTAFVSRNHARRHGAECFVYNGVDPDDYLYKETKDGSILFLAKAAWRVKNVAGAIRIARRARKELHVLGGKRLLFNHWRGVHWHGMLGGKEKAEKIANSSALIFPVLWNEPFGLAVIEAMVSGTPVLASPLGSLPELIGPGVGKICHDDEDYLLALEHLGAYKPQACRDWVLERFTHRTMAASYLKMYEKVLAGHFLNSTIPVTQDALEALDSLPLRTMPGSSSAQPA